MKHKNITKIYKQFKYKLTNKIMDEELIELCPVCLENEATYFTECNHKYCITCLSRIRKCSMYRKVYDRTWGLTYSN